MRSVKLLSEVIQVMSTAESRKKWNKENYDTILVNIPKGKKEDFKEKCAKEGISMNSFFNNAIQDFLDRDQGFASIIGEVTPHVLPDVHIRELQYDPNIWLDKEWRMWPELSLARRTMRPASAPVTDNTPVLDLSPIKLHPVRLTFYIQAFSETDPQETIQTNSSRIAQLTWNACMNGYEDNSQKMDGWLSQIKHGGGTILNREGADISWNALEEAASNFRKLNPRTDLKDSLWICDTSIALSGRCELAKAMTYPDQETAMKHFATDEERLNNPSGFKWTDCVFLEEGSILLIDPRNLVLMTGNTDMHILKDAPGLPEGRHLIALSFELAALVESPQKCVLQTNFKRPDLSELLA